MFQTVSLRRYFYFKTSFLQFCNSHKHTHTHSHAAYSWQFMCRTAPGLHDPVRQLCRRPVTFTALRAFSFLICLTHHEYWMFMCSGIQAIRWDSNCVKSNYSTARMYKTVSTFYYFWPLCKKILPLVYTRQNSSWFSLWKYVNKFVPKVKMKWGNMHIHL